jgi:hypothetical protein
MQTPTWSATLRLATVVSVVAAVVAVLLVDVVAEPLLIGCIIAGASLVGWLHAEGMLRLQPARVRRR